MRKITVYAFMMLFSLLVSFLMAGGSSTVGSNLNNRALTVKSESCVANGDFETGTLDGWEVKGICSVSNSIVHNGVYSAYVSDYTGAPNCDDWLRQNVSSSHLTIDSGITLEAWVYPLQVGPIDGQYPMSRIELWFMNESSMTWAYTFRYTWCNSERFNVTGAGDINFELFSWNVSEWNFLHRNVTADAFSVFGNIDFSNITLYYVDATYHYSTYSPGAFYVDDILLTKSTIVVPDDYPTIQAAINAASAGDAVFVRNGTYYENVVVNKQVGLLGENRIGTIIDANATGIVLNIVTSNVSVSCFTIKGGGSTSPDSGVLLQGAANCSVFGNRIIGNLGDGIFLMGCSNNVIFGNEVVGNDVDGISVSGSTGNSISDNNVTGNGWSGIGLFGYSSENNVTSNIVANNPEGIAVVISARNEISENTIMSNSNWGISIYQSLNNSIFHNNFNNTLQLNSDGSPNMWDNGCEGNYWSDYKGTDSNGDGVGDVSHMIDANNTDRYPLMNVYWSPCDVNHDLKIDIRDISLAAKAFSTVPGMPLWNPHADITGPDHFVPDGKVDMRDIALIAKHFGEHL